MGRLRAYGTALVLLAILGAILFALRVQLVSRVEADPETERRGRVSAAFGVIDDEFQALQRTMVQLAQRIAEDPVVRRSLENQPGDGTEADANLVAAFRDLRLSPLQSVELYTPTPRLLAWNGFSMPLDDAPESDNFLETYQTGIALDAGRRAALVLWWPVRDGPRVYGAVRVMRILQSNTPVQNEFLSDYNIGRQWSWTSGLPVELVTGRARANNEDRPWRELRGIDGSVVGIARVSLPSDFELIEAARSGFDSALVFVMALALVLVLYLLYEHLKRTGRQSLGGATTGWLAFAGGLWLTRFVLLRMQFPERLQPGKSPLAPLFDPTHFASDFLGGVMRTSGDLIVTALLVAITAVTLYRNVAAHPNIDASMDRWRRGVLVAVAAAGLLIIYAGIFVLAAGGRSLVLDSTLDYFARSGLVPDILVLAVFSAALVIVASAVVASAAASLIAFRAIAALRRAGTSYAVSLLMPALIAGSVVGAVYAVVPFGTLLPPVRGILILIGFLITSLTLHYWGGSGAASLTLRNTLFAAFVVAAFLYPLLYSGVQAQRRGVLVDAAETFDNGSDPRVVFSIERLLEDTASDSIVVAAITTDQPSGRVIDSLATVRLRASLLASLRSYEINLTLLDTGGTPLGGYYEADQQISDASLEQLERADFDLLRAMYADAGGPASLVEQVTGRHERERFRYEGLRPVVQDGERVGWVMAGAEPRSMTEEVGTPFPRVFVSTGFYGAITEDISLAEFRDGILVRTTGSSFGRLRLDEGVEQQMRRATSMWRRESVRGRSYETYYVRHTGPANAIRLDQSVIVAARMAATTVFDHLYSLLRLTVAGLFVAIPLYLFGIVARWRAGLLPAPRVRFRDKVLNAFFAVGIVTVAAMGFVGLQVVTGENDRAVDSWLRQHLERVERTLAAEARAGELPYRVLDRISMDSLSAQVGLDLNLFQGTELIDSSRPQLVRDRLIDPRLPVGAYSALNFEGYRFVSLIQQVGSVSYAAGYRALPDEAGVPRYVLSVPTLPEQERIEEERARTIAYLFGALLLLVLVVLATASVLANALTRPIARLRIGLEAVAQGRFEGIRPVNSRDELGDLVETFNAMQGQLADSRTQLAQQERQLAWREMARQVAHEIKNPLTPMKLSIQHLQRALTKSGTADADPEFKSVFGRITSTLVDQIDTLARIANEFSSFARMPRQIFEPLDVNTVMRDAVALIQAESGTTFETNLSTEPIVVRADREELRRVFINLLKNAVQAIPAHRVADIQVATRVEEREGGDVAVCEIEDNGAGIPEKLRARIFEPNFSTKTSGTGLGLAIVKKAVEDMNGDISFDTRTGAGTVFRITLPLSTDSNA